MEYIEKYWEKIPILDRCMTEPGPCGTVDEKEGHGVEYSDEIDYSIAKRFFSLIIYELKVRCGLQGLIPVPEHMHCLDAL